MAGSWTELVRFGKDGLVPAVVQELGTKRVLMLGYMNKEALELTVSRKRVYFWSRSRGELWCKGESSGHVQRLVEIRLDCDGDAILVMVEQEVGACHTGHESCFFRALEGQSWVEVDPLVFDPKEVYGKSK
ncbi:MAG: phosphoribosyl-AMP cyclohydrolase [bacterium]